jgi:hypothetical protein
MRDRFEFKINYFDSSSQNIVVRAYNVVSAWEEAVSVGITFDNTVKSIEFLRKLPQDESSQAITETERCPGSSGNKSLSK